MTESALHIQLTNNLRVWAETNFDLSGSTLAYWDSPGSNSRPKKIYGHVPDMLITDAPCTFTIIGEAKPEYDLDNEHTRSQLCSFLRYLKFCPTPTFLLSIQWQSHDIAHDMLLDAIATSQASAVRCFLVAGPLVSEVTP